ncbi:hypothetical protein AMECASPLE_015232 [Ameca splendens]|uniref:Uncharacterized protein n=1 Tax=Ameca splendens TaxID=208324 RepID=A0ABV0XEY6_9TELE
MLSDQSVFFCTASSIVGRGGAQLVPISSSLWVRGGVHPGQIASPSQGNTQTTKHTLIHTPKGNLERLINLTGISLDCGRKPERTIHAGGEHANSMQPSAPYSMPERPRHV